MKRKQNNIINKIKILCIFSILTTLNFPLSHNLKARDYIDRGHIVIDLKNKVEWLKCSVGQVWDTEKCTGDSIKVSLKEAEDLLPQVNQELGGEWRLPNKKELVSIICKTCSGAKINETYFPNSQADIYWTSQRNWWSPQFFWSVNFMTGHAYGRFVPEKKLFVRFLRDR